MSISMSIARFMSLSTCRRSLLVVAALVAPACTPDPVILPVRNLERPADLGFACVQRVMGSDMKPRLTGRPMVACHDPDPQTKDASGAISEDRSAARVDHPYDATTGQRIFSTFGLLTNTARGEVAVVYFPGNAANSDTLVDLDPTAPGFNHIPVGGFPESISVSDDGCRAVTANRSTCDLSVIDVPGVLAPSFGLTATTTLDGGKAGPRSSTIKVANVRAQPREVVALPDAPVPKSFEESIAATAPVCSPDTTDEVVVTFPGCSLVAIVEVPTGRAMAESVGGRALAARIKSSVRINPDGSVVDAGTNPTCAEECGFGGGAVLAPAGPDAGQPEAGAPVPGPVDASADASEVGGDASEVGAEAPAPNPPGVSGAIGGLAVTPDGSELFVGLVEAPYVVRLGITGPKGARTLVPQGPAGTLALAEGAVGVTRLRLSVDPFARGPRVNMSTQDDQRWVGERGRFLYAIARDGSIRVIQVADSNGAPTYVECDANVEPSERLIQDNVLNRKGCLPIGTLPRQVLAKGPGVRIPPTQPDISPPLPVDIAFLENGPTATGLLLGSNGLIYHVNLGLSYMPKPEKSDTDQTHWFLRAPAGFSNSRAGLTPEVSVEPTRNFSNDPIERALAGQTTLPFPTKVAFASNLAGPRLESYRLGSGTSAVDSWAYFPDNYRELVPPERMNVEWEGVATGFPRISGRVEVQSGAGDTASPAGALSDTGANFCKAGVRVGDIVTLIGCDQDIQCDALRDEICHRAAPGAPGVCVPRSLAQNEDRVRLCRSEFASRRRYEVREVKAGRLTFGLKLDEVPRPAVAPCDPATPRGSAADVCQPTGTGHGADPGALGDPGFVCKVLAGGGQPRCVKPCAAERPDGTLVADDSRCRSGHVCASGPDGFLCVEAPAPRPECLTGDLRYAVQVGRAYRVVGSLLPSYVTAAAESDGTCRPLPPGSPLLQDRIPLDAPLCTKPPQPLEGGVSLQTALPSAIPAPANPCMFQAPNEDDSGSKVPHWKALYQNPHIRFVLTNLEQYTGDAAYVDWQVQSGFEPLRVLATGGGSDVALGTRIVTGPMASVVVEGSEGWLPLPPYMFVVDQGKTTVDLSRGQLLRINPRFWSSRAEGGRLDSQYTNTRFPIQ